MKTFLMMILFAGGFAIQQLDAQNCCLPCPPGCCVTSCSKSAKGAAADAKTTQPVEATFASFLIAAQETLGQQPGMPVTKECLPSCQASHVSQASLSTEKGTAVACKTNYVSNAKCGISSTAAVSTPSTQPTRIKEKS